MAEHHDKIKQRHFILVHGLCHGAWCWYKLIPRLQSAGHRVTAVDLAGSGTNLKSIGQDVLTFDEYTEPLLKILASLTPNEKVILVGHSLGGLNLALAMDRYPDKVSVGVFLTAYMPDTTNQPSYVIDQRFEGVTQEMVLDTQFISSGSSQNPLSTMIFGPNFMSYWLYHLCPMEDVELAKTLVRAGSLFQEDLSKANKFSEQGYGSVARVFVVCKEDKAIDETAQRWMIENYPPEDVMEIDGADHMAMMSNPQELCDCLSKIAKKYT
ncbi:hypothetical protein SLE2022_302460 [Rubroshorea leprosula]